VGHLDVPEELRERGSVSAPRASLFERVSERGHGSHQCDLHRLPTCGLRLDATCTGSRRTSEHLHPGLSGVVGTTIYELPNASVGLILACAGRVIASVVRRTARPAARPEVGRD
jgi:hypothetical protein